MSQTLIAELEQSHLKTDLPALHAGDTIDVHYRIIEGTKERIQIFSGVILKLTGTGLNQMMMVRRIVANEGVERTFPVHSPKVFKIIVKRNGDARRARLYFLRDRVGKSRRLRDRRRGLAHLPQKASKKS